MAVPPPLTATDGPNLESSASAIHWSSILGGATVAAALSLMLVPLGSALGYASVSAFNSDSVNAVKLTSGWAIWLIITQWISAGVGGYIAGRMRVKWADTHSDEVFFRDTAHGFITWSVSTLFTFAFVAWAGVMVANHTAPVVLSALDEETARKAMIGVWLVLFLSLLIGAFIASVSAALGGKLRDQY